MTIVVLDGYSVNPGDNPWEPLLRLGDVTVNDHTRDDQVVQQATDAQIIVTNKAAVTAQALAQLPQLKYVTVTATGYNIVDIEAAAKRGIPVSNVPAYATEAVVQFVFALLLELCYRVGVHDTAVKAGEWVRSAHFSFTRTPLTELTGKTMGIVGFGRIGSRVAEVAHAFGMNVLAYSPSKKPSPSYEPFAWAEALEELFEKSDVVSLHAPSTPLNQGFVNAKLLSKMRPSAMLINTARGQLINEQDLADALNHGQIAGAGVDVLAAEPMRADNPLLHAKNIVITPHIAWAPLEARRRVMKVTVENVSAFLAGKPINIVNAGLLK